MEQEKIYRIEEIEEVLAEMDFSDVDDDIAEIDEDFMIQVSGWYLFIPALGITVREGVACVFDEEEKMFMPDFDVTVLYEGEVDAGNSRIGDSVVRKSGECEQAPIPADFLYYEQDGIVITLANWLNGRMQIEAIEKLECVLKIANVTN
ncbi:MAG: hypothetical protein PHD56_06500 [Anaerostipes sp.]|jgi:hypothetical protein|uniref:hypothetical protein n=1 Tax=Enterocloster bolteae TaxID=208479 RepID=UPI0021097AEF|nr:hypothetical protein [Enterocloster bolteae]MCQ4754680.1 hypothetical protein [Enterocloster bolteae]MDD4370703.1 hypothetical protein [Anaerostipes sp.]